jgi:tetratricopeptide (TPR) repeat protein
MPTPEDPSESPDNLRGSGKEKPSPLRESFRRSIEAYQKGVEANNTEQIEAAALHALAASAEIAEKEPRPELTLKLEAGKCEGRGDWAGAEALYHQVLGLEEASGNLGLIAKAHYDLSKLFLLIEDLDKADAAARKAAETARRADIFPLLVISLENLAVCELRRSNFAGALAAASEALSAIESGRMFDSMRAAAFVVRARCRLASGDIAGAENDLSEARPVLLEREVSPIFAGISGRVAAWWEVTAGIRASQSDLPGACEAWAEAVKCRRHVASLPHVSGPYTLATLARSLVRQGKAMEASGDREAGKASREEAARIWCELGLPDTGLN